MIGSLMLFYLRFIRPWMSAFLLRVWRLFTRRGHVLFSLGAPTIELFLAELKSCRYRSDPAGGLFDFSIERLDDFFRLGRSGRDCDDYSTIWLWWLKKNRPGWFSAQVMMCGSDLRDIVNSHSVTIAIEKPGKIFVFDGPTAREESGNFVEALVRIYGSAFYRRSRVVNVAMKLDAGWRMWRQGKAETTAVRSMEGLIDG